MKQKGFAPVFIILGIVAILLDRDSLIEDIRRARKILGISKLLSREEACKWCDQEDLKAEQEAKKADLNSTQIKYIKLIVNILDKYKKSHGFLVSS